jgi:hypothetical protein
METKKLTFIFNPKMGGGDYMMESGVLNGSIHMSKIEK